MPRKIPSKTATRSGTPSRSMKESSFHKVIYLRRNELKNIQVLKDTECWPKTVFIMDENFDIDGPIWTHPVNGEPCTLFAWAESEFKKCFNAPLEHVHQALRIWWGLHEQVITYLIHRKNFSPDMERLIYNTVWCLLGYEVGQPSAVLDLAHKVMLDPDFEKCGLIIKFPTQTTPKVTNKDPDSGYPASTGTHKSSDYKDKSIHHGQETTIPFRTASKGTSDPPRPRTPSKVIQKKSAAPKDTTPYEDEEEDYGFDFCPKETSQGKYPTISALSTSNRSRNSPSTSKVKTPSKGKGSSTPIDRKVKEHPKGRPSKR